jgi:hypothetical protein
VLTDGPQSDWVRNVLGEGGCTIETRGRRLRFSHPRLVHDEQRRLVPAPIRLVAGVGNVADFLVLDRAG